MISAVFDQPKAGFVLLPAGAKFPPIESGWQRHPHTYQEAISHQGNVGILAGNGFIGLDQDDPATFEGLELPPTTLWETRPGRLGLWFKCHDVIEALQTIDKKNDLAQLKLFKDGKHCGEIKLGRTYQVIPPSWKLLEDGTQADYKLLQDITPTEIILVKLLADLQGIGITFSSKLEINAKKLEEIGRKSQQRRAESDEALSRRYAEAALEKECQLLACAPTGNRNEQLNKSAFALGQFVAAGVLDEAEVVRELHRVADCAGLDSEEIERTIRSGLEAGSKHPREIPPTGNTETRTEPSEILERIKADPRALKNPVILADLAALKAGDPIEYDLFLDNFRKAKTGIKVDTINNIVDEYVSKLDNTAEKLPETPHDIKEKALAIAERGDPLKYLVWQAQRNHLGDIDYQKVLIASIASAASRTSNGIQPGGNGDKGSGKSDACAAVYHLVPTDRRLDGSLSPMSLFYLQETGRLREGMILFSDDVEYEPIIPIYKRSTGSFQKATLHHSVTGGKVREAITLTIPPRLVWWLTSVESVANEQAFDRQYPISTDSSSGHKKLVSREIAARRARRELRLEEDEGIEVARAILADIFDNGPFRVHIPQADKAEWLKVSDFRGQEQFWDLVDSLVILRWRLHKQEDGWLIADDRDLIEAKDIITGHKIAHFADLTEAEAKLIGVMTAGHSMTQKELTETAGIAQSTLSERLRSIMAKSALVTEDYDQGKKVYALNPKMQLNSEFWKSLDLIDLKMDDKAYRSQQIALSVCYRYLIGLPIGIIINNSNRIPSSLSVNKEGSIEKGYPCDNCNDCHLGKEYVSLYSQAENTDNDQKEHQEPLSDTDKSDRYDPISTDNDISEPIDIPIRQSGAALGSIDIELRQAEEQRKAIEKHFETPFSMRASKTSSRRETDLVRVRFLKDYRTQISRPGCPSAYDDKLYRIGETAEFPEWKAKQLVERGIVELA